jgi:hypothetical protein
MSLRMEVTMTQPIPQRTYTFAEVTQLDLLDSPHLCVSPNHLPGVIQNSHVTDEQFLAIPGFADTQWRYIRTNHEWIPLFVAIDPKHVLTFLHWELDKNPLYGPEWWITPKAYPRAQYEYTT